MSDSMEELFDNRDPVPFRDRDLDPALVEYLLDGARDLTRMRPLRVEIWLGTSPFDDVPHAIRAYFQYAIDRTNRQRREQVRAGLIGLAIVISAVPVLITVANAVDRRLTGPVGITLRESPVISGWVLMWRPLDLLLYDRITWLRNRRILKPFAMRRSQCELLPPNAAQVPKSPRARYFCILHSAFCVRMRTASRPAAP